MVRILALDPGEKRIGLAISDELGWTAQGLPTLERVGPARDLAHVRRIVEERGVQEIVVGIPYREDGTIGASGELAMALARSLADGLQLTVTPWDERLTTKQAERAPSAGAGGISSLRC